MGKDIKKHQEAVSSINQKQLLKYFVVFVKISGRACRCKIAKVLGC